MRDLSFESEALLAEARAAFAPSSAARQRIRAGVAARAAAGAGGAAAAAAVGGASGGAVMASEPTPTAAPGAAPAGGAIGSGAIIKLAAAVALSAALFASAWTLWRLFAGGPGDARSGAPLIAPEAWPPSPPTPATPSTTPPTTPPTAPAPAATTPAPAATAPIAPPPAHRHPRVARAQEASELAREVALIRAARHALAAGDPESALALLRRHRREMRAPQMEREAWLLRAEALCRAGRKGDGRDALAAARSRWPGSAGTSAVMQACGPER